ncbi:MAG: hypothetical protein EBT95_09180, partial [Verrucomicrobia bacterium]|nr:hypothetical protein [Verrucomicrobiota bacterium]
MGSSLRAKIMSGVIALLVLFASALAITLYLIQDSSTELMGIEEYHLRLNKMVSDLDVYTFELEIIAHELNGIPPPAREHAQTRQARAHELQRIVGQIFAEAIPLAEKGSEDDRNDIGDRLGIARLIGSLRTLEVGTKGFVDAAIRSIDRAVEGKTSEARR